MYAHLHTLLLHKAVVWTSEGRVSSLQSCLCFPHHCSLLQEARGNKLQTFAIAFPTENRLKPTEILTTQNTASWRLCMHCGSDSSPAQVPRAPLPRYAAPPRNIPGFEGEKFCTSAKHAVSDSHMIQHVQQVEINSQNWCKRAHWNVCALGFCLTFLSRSSLLG
jgi:hypothetical protein